MYPVNLEARCHQIQFNAPLDANEIGWNKDGEMKIFERQDGRMLDDHCPQI